MKKKKKRKLMLLIFIILAIAILVIILTNIDYSKLNHKKYGYENQGLYKDPKYDSGKGRTSENQLLFSGIDVFYEKYKGDFKTSEIMQELKKIVTNRLPKTYDIIKNYDETELETFFQKNKNSLLNMYGVQTSEEFIELAKKIKEQNVDFNKYLKLNVIPNTFVNDSDKDGYSYAEAELEYEDGSTIDFTFYVAKSSTTEPQYITNIK